MKIWWLKEYFKFHKVKLGSHGLLCYIKCQVQGCRIQALTYNMGNGTTSSMINLLKRVHKTQVSSMKNPAAKPGEEKNKTPYSIYNPKYMHITRGLPFHIIKDKLFLNPIESSNYHFLLYRMNARQVQGWYAFT